MPSELKIEPGKYLIERIDDEAGQDRPIGIMVMSDGTFVSVPIGKPAPSSNEWNTGLHGCLPAEPAKRQCTCHPDERPSPCPGKYAFTDCQLAAKDAELAALRAELKEAQGAAQAWRSSWSRAIDDYADARAELERLRKVPPIVPRESGAIMDKGVTHITNDLPNLGEIPKPKGEQFPPSHAWKWKPSV